MPGRASGSETQWSHMDADSEGEAPSRRSSQRIYVDPWDLRQYSFARRRDDIASGSEVAHSAVGEPVSASFYYVPTKYDSDEEEKILVRQKRAMLAEERALMANQQPIYDSRSAVYPRLGDYEVLSAPNQEARRMSRKMSRNSDYYSTGTGTPDMHSLGYDMLSFEERKRALYNLEDYYYNQYPELYETTAAVRRSTAVPPNMTMLAMPRRQQLTPGYNAKNARRSRFMDSFDKYAYESVMVDYDIDDLDGGAVGGIIKAPPENFHLSRYGHLQIDYSCSWDSLDRLIRNQ